MSSQAEQKDIPGQMISLIQMQVFIPVKFIFRADERILQDEFQDYKEKENEVVFLHGT